MYMLGLGWTTQVYLKLWVNKYLNIQRFGASVSYSTKVAYLFGKDIATVMSNVIKQLQKIFIRCAWNVTLIKKLKSPDDLCMIKCVVAGDEINWYTAYTYITQYQGKKCIKWLMLHTYCGTRMTSHILTCIVCKSLDVASSYSTTQT